MVNLLRTSRLFGWAVDGAPGILFIITYLATRDFYQLLHPANTVISGSFHSSKKTRGR